MATKLETLEELEEHLMLVLNQIEWLEAERMQYEQAICDMCPHENIHEAAWFNDQPVISGSGIELVEAPLKRFRVCKRCGLAEYAPYKLFERDLVPIIDRSDAIRRVRKVTSYG